MWDISYIALNTLKKRFTVTAKVDMTSLYVILSKNLPHFVNKELIVISWDCFRHVQKLKVIFHGAA